MPSAGVAKEPACLEVPFYCGPCFQCGKEIQEPERAHVRKSPTFGHEKDLVYDEAPPVSQSTGIGYEFFHKSCCPECHQGKVLPFSSKRSVKRKAG